jgi:hypothetical protein
MGKFMNKPCAKALTDGDLLAEVDRQRLDMEPSSGEAIQALHRDLIDQKRDVIERVKKLLEN